MAVRACARAAQRLTALASPSEGITLQEQGLGAALVAAMYCHMHDELLLIPCDEPLHRGS